MPRDLDAPVQQVRGILAGAGPLPQAGQGPQRGDQAVDRAGPDTPQVRSSPSITWIALPVRLPKITAAWAGMVIRDQRRVMLTSVLNPRVTAQDHNPGS